MAYRAALENQGIAQVRPLQEFVKQTRFSNSGLADNGERLATPLTSGLPDALQCAQFTIATDEAGQTSTLRCKEA